MKRNVLAQLGNVQSLVISTLKVCQGSKKSSEIKQVLANAKAEVGKALHSISESNKRRRLTQTKKSLVVLDNTFSGLIEGLQAKELSVSEFRAVCSNLETKFIPKFQESLSSESDRIIARFQGGASADASVPEEALTEQQVAVRAAIAAASDVDHDVAAATQALDESQTVTSSEVEDDEEEDEIEEDEDEREERLTRERSQRDDADADEVADRLARLRKMRNLMPAKLKTPYSMVRMPIVPIFETANATHPNLLDKLSIPNTEIPLPLSASQGRYVIFEQQVLLLISRDSVNDMIEQQKTNRDARTKETVKEKKGGLKTLTDKIQAVQMALERARKKAGATREPRIKELEAKVDQMQRDLDKKFNSGRTPEERELRLQIARADRTEAGTQNVGFLLKARNALRREEVAIEKLSLEDRKKALKGLHKLQTALEEAEAKYKGLQKQLEKLRMVRADKTDKANMAEIKELEKKLRILRKKEEERVRPVRDLEERYARLNAQYEEEEEKIVITRRSAKRATNMSAEDYARSVLAIINERGGTRYSLVTNIATPNPRNTDIMCFWTMPSGKLSALLKATGGKAKVKEWSFPWSDERHRTGERPESTWVHPSRNPKHPDFLEFDQNKHLRPEGWKTRMKKPPKPIQ